MKGILATIGIIGLIYLIGQHANDPVALQVMVGACITVWLGLGYIVAVLRTGIGKGIKIGIIWAIVGIVVMATAVM